MKPLCLSLRILVPVDFSPCSRSALDYATALARHCQAKLLLLHVVELYPCDYLFGLHTHPEQVRPLLAHAQSALDRWRQCCLEAGAPAVQTTLRLGKPFKEILRAVARYHVQLLVVGTHGYCGLQPVTLGSTAQHLVRSAPCPVLLIPEPLREFVWEDQDAARPRDSIPTSFAV